MDVTAMLTDPEILYLAAGAAALGAALALMHAYRALQNGNGWLKRVLLLAPASALFVSGPILIARGF